MPYFVQPRCGSGTLRILYHALITTTVIHDQDLNEKYKKLV